MKELNYEIMPGEIWHHYEGGNYKIITLANNIETNEAFVVYQSISFGSIYVEPLKMWEETIENKRGGIQPKFKKIEEETFIKS